MNNYILPIKPGSQIGLFGGSFNPAHEWHFQVSKNALSELNLNQVIWLVSMSNPLKEDEDIMDFHDRFMSARDIAKKNNFFVSDFEKEYKTKYSIEYLVLNTKKGLHPSLSGDLYWGIVIKMK